MNDHHDELSVRAEHERRAWAALAALVARLPAALDQPMVQTSATTFHVYSVLAILRDEPSQRMRLSDLAERSNSSLSRLSHAMRRMEVDGLVVREPDPVDRRASYAVLTDGGRERVELLRPDHQALVRTLVLGRLDDAELAMLEQVAGRIVSGITEEAAKANPPQRRYARPADRR